MAGVAVFKNQEKSKNEKNSSYWNMMSEHELWKVQTRFTIWIDWVTAHMSQVSWTSQKQWPFVGAEENVSDKSELIIT